MSIASRINAIIDHIGDIYDTLELGGAINVDKNIINIHTTFRSQLLDWMNEGPDIIWDNWEKVIGTGTSLTLSPTIEAPMRLTLKGDTYQKTTTGKNLFNKNNITYDMLDIYENTSAGATRIIASETKACVYIQIAPNSEKFSISGMGKSYDVAALTSIPVAGGGDAVYTWTFRNTQTGNYTTPSLPSSCTYLAIFFTPGDSTIAEVVENVQIEKNNTVTPYEEYTGGPSPNPNYPQDVQNVTGYNEVYVVGKNLFSISSAITDTGTQYVISNPNSIRVYRTTTGSYSYAYIDKIIKAGTYSVSCVASVLGGAKRFLIQHKVNGSYTTLVNMEATMSSTFTLNTDEELRFIFYANGSGTSAVGDITYSNIQLEKGNQATTYEPYQGRSYEINLGKNLLDNKNGSITINGVEFTKNNDGSITINGTATDNIYYHYGANNTQTTFKIDTSKTYSLSIGNTTFPFKAFFRISDSVDTNTFKQCMNAYGTNTYKVENIPGTFFPSGIVSPFLFIYSGETINNFILYPQFEIGETATSYAPYFTPIELCKIGNYQDKIFKSGHNLFNPNVATNNCTVNNGFITITSNYSDVYIEGVFAYNEAYRFLTLPSGSYYMKSTNPNVRITFYGTGSLDTNGTQPRTLTEETKFGGIRIRSINGTSLQNVSFALMLSTENIDFEPYGTDWYKYSAIGKVVLNGSESGWALYNASGSQPRRFGNYNHMWYADSIPIMSNYFIGDLVASQTDLSIWTQINYLGITDKNSNWADANALKTWLGTHNTEVYYILATPTYDKIPNTLVDQLEAIKSCTGQTSITSEQIDLDATALKEV